MQALAAQGNLAEALGIYGRLSECLRDELGVSPIIFGSPMGASGFEQLVGHFTDRTVITYDPRGMERSTREPGSNVTVEAHAEDYHRVVEAVGLGSVDAFGSSGGGMCGLHWLVSHPEDVHTFVSHEPPVITLLEDSQMAIKVERRDR